MDDNSNNIKVFKRRFAINGNLKIKLRRESISLFNKKQTSIHNDSSSIKSPKMMQKNSIFNPKFSFYQIEKLNTEELKKEIYNTNAEKDCPNLIKKFFQVKNCSVLKYGAKQSTEKIEYSYCMTCDPTSIYPICMACIRSCHIDHIIKKSKKIGNIKCYCGYKLHQINNLKKYSTSYDNNKNIKCLCNEWNEIAKLNIFYTTKDDKNVCEFCNVVCSDKFIIENSIVGNDFDKKKSNILNFNMQENCILNIPECDCDCVNIHNNKKNILYGNIFFFCKYNSIYEKLLHPLQIINMVFKSQVYFRDNFVAFCESFSLLRNPLKIKSIFEKLNDVEFTQTGLYLSLHFFRQLIQKLSHKKLFYFCPEIKSFFNFENLKKLYMNSPIHDKHFLLFMKEYLYLFNKIYINRKTKFYYKYSINDLENFSCVQRIILSKNNKKNFPEAEEIIKFFIEWLNNIDTTSKTYIESLNCIYQISLIIYKIIAFNLVTKSNIVRFLLKIIKIIDDISYKKNRLLSSDNNFYQNNKNKRNFATYKKSFTSTINITIINQMINTYIESNELSLNIEIKICYITIKILICTLYNYNDKIFEKYIFENQNNLQQNLSKKKNFFLFNDTELWPMILKITIIILSFIQNNYKIADKKEYKIYKLILEHSMTIFEHSLCAQDIYYFNLVKSLNDIKTNYINIIEYTESEFTSNIINEIIEEKANISSSYKNFLNFEFSNQELLSNVNDSLNKVLGDDKLSLLTTLYNDDFEPCCFNNEKNIGIIKTAYFFEISKMLEIINNNLNNEKCINKENEKSFSNNNNSERSIEENENISKNNLLKITDYIKKNNYKNIIDKIILFYFCFANKSSNNSLIILSRYILNELTKLPSDYGYLVFKLIHSCFLNIVSIDSIIINSKNIIKISYKFLQKLIFNNDKKILNCIYIFLKILEDLVYKIKNYHSSYIYTVQKYIILLHNDYQFSFKYFDLIEKEETKEKKLNSIKSFSSSKCSEFSNQNNNNNDFSNMNKENEISKEKEESENKENNDKNILKNGFIIYLKLINDIFDFSITKEREKVKKIININSIIYLLKNYNLNLNIRSEFLKYSRKMFVDLTYSENSNELYTKAIVNDEDNLLELKLNPLTNNDNYPTKYLSFIKDFYNISAKNILQERQNLVNDIQESKILTKENENNLFPKISITSKNTSQDEDNFSIDNFSTNRFIQSPSISQISKKNDSHLLNPKKRKKKIKDNPRYSSSSFFKRNSKLLNSNNKILNDENNLPLIPEKDFSQEIQAFGINNNRNFESSSLDSNSEAGKVELEIISQNDAEDDKSSENELKEKSIKKIEKISNDSINEINADKESVNINLKENGNFSIPSASFAESCIKEKENKLNLLPCFDDLFYGILKYELENLTVFIEQELSFEVMDEEIAKNTLQNYLENGLLISIIYFFKKSFSLIHNFSGEEMIKFNYLVEQSINLKLYISKLKYDLWEEDDENDYEKEIKIEDSNKNILNINILKNDRKSLIKGKCFKNKKLIKQTYKSLDAVKSKKISMFDYITLYQIIEKEFFDILKDKRILTFNKVFEPEQNIELQKQIKQMVKNNLKNKNKNIDDMNEKFYSIYLKYQYNKTFLTNEKNSPLFNLLSEVNMTAKSDYMNLLLKFLICCWRNENQNREYKNRSFYLLYKLLSIKTNDIQLNMVNSIKNEKDRIIHEISDFLLEKIILLIIEYLNPVNEIKNSHYLSIYTLMKFFKTLCQDNNYFFKHYLLKETSYKYIDEIPFYYKTIPGTNKIITSPKNNNLSTREITNNTNSIYNSLLNQPISYIYYYSNFFDFFLLFSIKIIIISNWDDSNYYKDCTHQNAFLYKLFNAILEVLKEIIRGSDNNFILENEIAKKNNEKKSLLNNQFKTKIKEDAYALNIFFKYVCKILVKNRNTLEIFYKIKINIMEFILSLVEEKNINKNIKKEIPKYLNVNQIIRIINRILKNYYFNNNNSTIKIENKNNENKQIINTKYIKDGSEKYLQNNDHCRTINDNTLNIASTTSMFPLVNKNKNFLSIINYRLNKSSENVQQNTIVSNSNTKLNNCNNKVELNKTHKKTFEDTSKSSEKKELINIESSSKQLHLKSNFRNKLNKLKKLTSLKRIKKEIEWDFLEKTNDKNDDLQKKTKIIFDNKLCNYFIKEFYNEKGFRKTKEFILSNALYKYLKNIVILNDNIIMKQIINKVNSAKEKLSIKKELKKNPSDFKNEKQNIIIGFFNNKIKKQIYNKDANNNYDDKEFTEKFYIAKFFENITSSIEVNLADHSNQIIYFTKIPEMIFLSKTTKKNLEHDFNRETEENIKKNLMKNLKYFLAEMKYFENHRNFNNFFKKFNFKNFSIISYIYAVALNIFLFSKIKGDEFLSVSNSNEFRRNNKSFINKSIGESLDEWKNLLYFFCYLYIVLNGAFIIIWIYYRLPILYRLDKIKYKEIHQSKNTIQLSDKLFIIIFMAISKRDKILIIIYEIFIAIISLFIERGEILYTLFLLPVIKLNSTLKLVVKSIKLRYKEFFLVLFLSAIIMYTLTNIAFFFFNSDYEAELDYYDDNYCKSLIFCFLNSLDNGLRARGGIGDSGKRISFLRNSNRYIGRLILDDFFFILIVIILIDMVFGIIVGSFTSLRHEQQLYKKGKNNHCFICSGKKSIFEKERINFEEHVKYKHNIWNYVEYIITIKQSKIRELNSINQYIRKKIDNNDISWLPTNTELIKKIEDNDNDEMIVLEEKGHEYIIKTNDDMKI